MALPSQWTRKETWIDGRQSATSPRSMNGPSCSSSATSFAVCRRGEHEKANGSFSHLRGRRLVSISGLFMVPGTCGVSIPMKCHNMSFCRSNRSARCCRALSTVSKCLSKTASVTMLTIVIRPSCCWCGVVCGRRLVPTHADLLCVVSYDIW